MRLNFIVPRIHLWEEASQFDVVLETTIKDYNIYYLNSNINFQYIDNLKMFYINICILMHISR